MDKKLQDIYFSKTRLEVYENFQEYGKNLQHSKEFYIPLAVLEVSLRNSIDNYFKNKYSVNWFDSDFLSQSSRKKIVEVSSRLQQNSDELFHDKILAELSFGFWSALFRKDYAHIMRIKALKYIFPNLPEKDKKLITREHINKKLNHIRKFRNRVFHYEKIINKEEFKNIENDIYEIIGYFDDHLAEYAKKVNNG